MSDNRILSLLIIHFIFNFIKNYLKIIGNSFNKLVKKKGGKGKKKDNNDKIKAICLRYKLNILPLFLCYGTTSISSHL